MQGQTFKTVHLQNLDYRPCQPSQFKMEQSWKPRNGKLLTYQENGQANHHAKFKNGIFSAFYKAYNNHGDVKITPDDIWMTIMLYFSKYVNDNSQQLREAFVSHQGKEKLTVVTENEQKETQWDQFFTLMIQEIKKKTTKGVTEKFECNFSTTTRLEKIFSTAIVMNTYKKYFDYGRMMIMCGIQNIHFGGTLNDWKLVLEKTENLAEYDVNGDLKKYVKNVVVILQKFIQTYQGKVDLQFWNTIIHEQGVRMSGMQPTIDGWLINLFGYVEKTESVDIEEIDVDIEIDNQITKIKKTVKLVGGFRGVIQQGQIFRPHLSMAIIDAPPQEQKRSQW